MNILWYILVGGGALTGGLLHSKSKEIKALKAALRAQQRPTERHFRSFEA